MNWARRDLELSNECLEEKRVFQWAACPFITRQLSNVTRPSGNVTICLEHGGERQLPLTEQLLLGGYSSVCNGSSCKSRFGQKQSSRAAFTQL